MWAQRTIRLQARPPGFHLVTAEVLGALPELGEISVGILHLLIQHTSASLALSENASADVRRDFEAWFDRAVPERAPYWTHTLEGDDDMPAHVKAALLGPSLTLPVSDGRPALGTLGGSRETRKASSHAGSGRGVEGHDPKFEGFLPQSSAQSRAGLDEDSPIWPSLSAEAFQAVTLGGRLVASPEAT